MGDRLDKFLGWFKRPDGSWEKDDVWHEFPLFHGDWEEIHNKVEWYESPHIVDIYKDHKYIFKNIDMDRPVERYYEQSIGDGGFRSQMESETELPSGLGEMRIRTRLRTKTPPSGENDFGLIEYFVRTDIQYDIPDGIDNLPRFLAYPLNKFFKWAYMTFIAEELIEHDGEFAREKMYSYLDYLREYHGEEPVQAKSRQTVYEPTDAERRFFI